MACLDRQWKLSEELLRESLKISWQNKRLWLIVSFPQIISLILFYLLEHWIFNVLLGFRFIFVGSWYDLPFRIFLYGLFFLANYFYVKSIIDCDGLSYFQSLKLALRRVRHPFFILLCIFIRVGLFWPIFLLFGAFIIPLLVVVAYSDALLKKSFVDYWDIFKRSYFISISFAVKIFIFLGLFIFGTVIFNVLYLNYEYGSVVFSSEILLIVSYDKLIGFWKNFVFVGFHGSKFPVFFIIRLSLTLFLNSIVHIAFPALVAKNIFEQKNKRKIDGQF